VDGDAYAAAAVEARIQIGWNKFRQLVPLKIYHWYKIDTTPVVCEVVCCMEIIPGL